MKKEIRITAPDNLNEITLGQYQDYLSITDPTDEDVLRVFLRLSPAVIGKIPVLGVKQLVAHVSELLMQEPEFSPRFEMSGDRYGFIPNLEQMTYGENIDAVKYLPKTEDDWGDMHKAMAVLFRKVTAERRGSYVIEDYAGTLDRAGVYRNMPLGVALGALVFFLRFSERLARRYPEVYREGGDTPVFFTKWGAYNAVYTLAQGDIRRFEEITSLPLHTCLAFLAFENDKAEYEKKLMQSK